MKRDNQNGDDDSQNEGNNGSGGGGGGNNGGGGRPNKRFRGNDETIRLLIPSRIAGAIIGKGGQHINRLRAQDNGEFNIAISTLHALSNSMIISRAEKHSPHSSPRLSRRSTTPNVIPAATVPTPSTAAAPPPTSSDIYAGQQAILPTAPSMHSINGSNQPTNCNVMKPTSKQPTTSQSAVQSNRMSAPPMSSSATHQVINKVLNKALSADLNDIHANDQMAPPLPPRKSSPSVDNSVNRMLKPHSINNVTSASSLVNLSTNSTISSSLSRSENITFCDFDVPNSIAPPIPKHNVPRPIVQTVASDLQVLSTTDDDMDKVIVGPAETITGLIDTRPLDARKPIIIMSTDKEQSTNNESNNLYHMKTNSNQQNHQRNQSVPNSNTTSSSSSTTTTSITTTPPAVHASRPISTKSITAPQVCPETSSSSSGIVSTAITNADSQPLLYENVTINHKDCNVPYENINLEYIARLMNEGYSKESVVTALGISRNNIEMACYILHEFVSKNSA